MSPSRFERLAASLRSSDLSAVALNPGPALYHLSGLRFHLMERPVVLLIPAHGEPALVLPEFEMPKVDSFPFKVQAFPYGEDPSEWNGAFHRAVGSLGLDGQRIGVESRQMRLLEFHYVKSGAPQAEFPDASETLAALRLSKDESEISAMRRAVRIAEQALTDTIPSIRIGMTERELASELSMQLLKNGSEPDLPFAPIVSAGPNSANPHTSPSERKLQAGDLLVVDWGATHDGYISDLTRTFAIGNVDEECRKIHRIVQEANAAGCAAAKPGLPAAHVDRAAREGIERSGYGEFFNHRTGHGIGMEAHEEPYIRGDNPQILEAGMAFTVEPGIYLPRRNGVRIEDNVVITENGAEILSSMSRELQVIG